MNFPELTFIEPRLLWLLAMVPLLVMFKSLEFTRRRKALAKFSEVPLFLMQNPTQLGSKQAVFPRLMLYVSDSHY